MTKPAKTLSNANAPSMAVRLGGPGSFGYTGERQEGPLTRPLEGGSSLLMNGRPALETTVDEDGTHYDHMARLSTNDEAEPKVVDIVRVNDSYAISVPGEDGMPVLSALDKYSKPSYIDIEGSQVQVSHDSQRETLSIHPGAYGHAGELNLTFNN